MRGRKTSSFIILTRLLILLEKYEINYTSQQVAEFRFHYLNRKVNFLVLIQRIRNRHPGSQPQVLVHNNELKALAYSTPQLLALYEEYPHIVQTDGTYRLNNPNLPLYCITITDKHCQAQSVFFAIMMNETALTLDWVVQQFLSMTGTASSEWK